MHSSRITAICDGRVEPLFPTPAQGAPSPSPTLLIESHRCLPGDWQTRTIPNHVLTLFIEPGSVLHSANDIAPIHIDIPAQAVVLSLRDQLECIRWQKPAHVLSVQVDDQALFDAAQTLGRGQDWEPAPSSGMHEARLSSLLMALYAEQASGYASGRLFVDGVEQALASLLVSRHNGAAPRFCVEDGLPRSRAKRLVDYIDTHLDSPLRLTDMADCAGYSPSHFSRLFQQTFQTTPHRFVLELRIDRAKALLRQGEHSIFDIALLCGFQTQQHFARIFRRLVGIAPGQFRSKL
jgi:AraC family transcriptional regulator